MRSELPAASLDQIFRSARTYYGWTDTLIDEDAARAIYDLIKWGPTPANSSPARFVWSRSSAGKAKLAKLALEKNGPKVLDAPLIVIIGNAADFADKLPKLLRHDVEVMRKAFAQPGVAEATAMRNGTMQGG